MTSVNCASRNSLCTMDKKQQAPVRDRIQVIGDRDKKKNNHMRFLCLVWLYNFTHVIKFVFMIMPAPQTLDEGSDSVNG